MQKLLASHRPKLPHPALVLLDVLLPHRLVHVLQRLQEILLCQRHIHLLLELLHVLDILESSSFLQLPPHRHVCCLPAQVCDIRAAVPFGFLDHKVEIESLSHRHIFEVYSHQLFASLFSRQWDVYSLLKPPPQSLVQIPRPVGSSQHDHELILFVFGCSGAIHLHKQLSLDST